VDINLFLTLDAKRIAISAWLRPTLLSQKMGQCYVKEASNGDYCHMPIDTGSIISISIGNILKFQIWTGFHDHRPTKALTTS
jgi:hypothetical protein